MPTQLIPPAVLLIRDQADLWIGRKAALEAEGFRVVEDTNSQIDLLITNADWEGLQLALEADQQVIPIIIVAGAAHPIGIHDRVAILLEPVSDEELVSTARTLLFAGKPG